MDASDIRGMDDLDNLIEAARCLGLVQARKAFGQYGPDDAASEHGLHASISERSARLRAEVEALKAENAALASWQCLFTDGTTGLYHDGCGNAQCARDHLVVHLTAEVEALRADAERYRWLRNAAGRGAAGSIFDNFSGTAIDECIDAARAAREGRG